MRQLIFLLMLVCCTASGTAVAQQANARDLQETIHHAIKRAYPASVRIWAFDTIRNVRTGPQFTGVVATPEGHILTAAHVNTPGTTYKVMFPDGRSTVAVGRGEIELESRPFMPDVAMLKIVNEGVWPFAPMGHSAKLTKGMLSISIAYPESLDQALPMIRVGEIYDVHNEYGFLQSTCLMEPGDSGGPLFDGFGNVIGIHSAVDVSEKENFEVPVDLYRTYWTTLQQAKTYGDYPTQKDSAGFDTVSGSLKIFPELDEPDQLIRAKKEIRSSAVLISSTVSGALKQIMGALIETKGMKGLAKQPGTSLVISKSSYVGDHPTVSLAGKTLRAKVLTRDKLNDLVLLAIDEQLKGGIELAKVDTACIGLGDLGRFLASPLAAGKYRISVLGTGTFSLPKQESVGYLGAQVAYFGPLEITEAAAIAGTATFEKGDELLALNGEKVASRADFLRVSKKYWPGDSVSVELKRAGNTLVHDVVLGWKPEIVGSHQSERFEGGKSRRRDGFNAVFAHDARLKPEECGAAVFDLDGRFYGLNIGRYSRVSNLVIPASEVLHFVEQALAR